MLPDRFLLYTLKKVRKKKSVGFFKNAKTASLHFGTKQESGGGLFKKSIYSIMQQNPKK
jgi:hypothetical protein